MESAAPHFTERLHIYHLLIIVGYWKITRMNRSKPV